MGSGYRNIFVSFEYCASPLCPFDLLPSPKIEEHPKLRNINAVPIALNPIPLTPRRLRCAGSAPCGTSTTSPSSWYPSAPAHFCVTACSFSVKRPAFPGAPDTYRRRNFTIDWDTFTWTVKEPNEAA